MMALATPWILPISRLIQGHQQHDVDYSCQTPVPCKAVSSYTVHHSTALLEPKIFKATQPKLLMIFLRYIFKPFFVYFCWILPASFNFREKVTSTAPVKVSDRCRLTQIWSSAGKPRRLVQDGSRLFECGVTAASKQPESKENHHLHQCMP